MTHQEQHISVMTLHEQIDMMTRKAPCLRSCTAIEMLVGMQAWLRSMQAGVL